MGTSASSAGPGSNTPLVPSWLDDPAASPTGPQPLPPAAVPTLAPSDGNATSTSPSAPSAPQAGPPSIAPVSVPAAVPPFHPQRYQTARVNFTRFAGSRGRDRKALGRAIRSYVSRANGGAGKAARRMGASRSAAANIVDVFARIERDGVDKTFRDLNIDIAFAGSVEDAFLALTDVICDDGGLVDEGIARDAWCEVIANVDQFGISDLGTMSDSQRREVFAAFVSKTIELRIQNEIGAQGFKVAGTPSEIRQVSEELSSYVRTATSDEIKRAFPQNLAAVATPQLQKIGDTVYETAWAILETYKAP